MDKLQERREAWEAWQQTHYQKALDFYSKVPRVELNHGAEWHARRCISVTGTDAAAVMGYNKWHSALEVYKAKRLEFDDLEDVMTRRVMWDVGNALEPVAAQWACAQLEGARLPYGPHPKEQIFAQSKPRPWSRSQIDNLIEVPGLGLGVVECKTSDHPARVGFGAPCVIIDGKIVEASDQVPIYYQLQAHKEMGDMIESGVQVSFALVVLMSDFKSQPSIYLLPYDKDIHDVIAEQCDDFLFEHVMKGVEPELSTQEQAEVLSRQPVISGAYAEDPQARALAAQINAIKAAIKEQQSQCDALEAQLCTLIGECDGIKSEGELIATWKPRSKFSEEALKEDKPDVWAAYQKQSFDTTSFKSQNPALYKQYLRTGTARTLLIKYKGLDAA